MIAVTLIEVPAWGNTTLIEALWTLSGAISATVIFPNLLKVIAGYKIAWDAKTERIGRRIAWGYVRRELLRLSGALTIVGLGIYTDIQAPLMPGPSFITPTGIVLTVALFWLSAECGIQSVMDHRQRKAIHKALEQFDETEKAILKGELENGK